MMNAKVPVLGSEVLVWGVRSGMTWLGVDLVEEVTDEWNP